VVRSLDPIYVFHLASHVSGSRDLDTVLPTFTANLGSTVNLLRALAGGSCRRVVLAGSMEEPFGDPDSAVPCSPYAAAKWAASMYARFFHAHYSVPVVTARIFMVYGPAQMELRRLIPYVILSLLLDRSPRLSSGERPVDWIYVEDVVDGLLALAAIAGITGESIDIGTGELVTIRRVVELIQETTGAGAEPLFGTLADRPMEAVRGADCDASLDKIRWKPSTPLRVGLRKTVRWYRDHLDELAVSFDQ
jgi:nucleoside-diphosphate-sugar epimerase